MNKKKFVIKEEITETDILFRAENSEILATQIFMLVTWLNTKFYHIEGADKKIEYIQKLLDEGQKQ